MGFRFRKSFGSGPFRVNLSKSGIGYSVGGKGFRYTKKANSGTRTTTSIPGTGVSYVKETSETVKKKKRTTSSSGKKGGCLTPFIIIMVLLMMIGSCGGEADPAETTVPTTVPDRSFVETTAPLETTAPTTEPATEPTTEPTTEATTEPTTEATTEPTTEPTEPEYDYVLNTNTKKFHYEWCSSADDIKAKNRSEFTGTRDEVISKGYEPCGRCKP